MEKITIESSPCTFCKLSKIDDAAYGSLYKIKEVIAHHYCLLFSCTLQQKGADNEGILGFLVNDILAELKKAQKILCHYCYKPHASTKCYKCKLKFHFPCGIKNGSLHQFIGVFKSFCKMHKPVQKIPEKIIQEASESPPLCAMCRESVNIKKINDTIWAPCCSKTWYHKECVQKYAYNAGSLFKCPICNDHEIFKKWVTKYGIYIPQQDASWELEPGAFRDLLVRHDKCDAIRCKCPEGDKFHEEDTRWEIILCRSCGSQGMHIGCGNLKFHNPQWECDCCKVVGLNTRRNRNRIKNKSLHSKSTENDFSIDFSDEMKITTKNTRKRKRASQNLKSSSKRRISKARGGTGGFATAEPTSSRTNTDEDDELSSSEIRDMVNIYPTSIKDGSEVESEELRQVDDDEDESVIDVTVSDEPGVETSSAVVSAEDDLVDLSYSPVRNEESDDDENLFRNPRNCRCRRRIVDDEGRESSDSEIEIVFERKSDVCIDVEAEDSGSGAESKVGPPVDISVSVSMEMEMPRRKLVSLSCAKKREKETSDEGNVSGSVNDSDEVDVSRPMSEDFPEHPDERGKGSSEGSLGSEEISEESKKGGRDLSRSDTAEPAFADDLFDRRSSREEMYVDESDDAADVVIDDSDSDDDDYGGCLVSSSKSYIEISGEIIETYSMKYR